MSRLSSHAARPGPKRRLGASLSANPAPHTFTSPTGQAAPPTRPFPNNNPTSNAFHSNAGHSPQRWHTILPQAQQESQNEWIVSDPAANHRAMAMESNGARGDLRQFEYAASPSRPTSNGRNPGPTSQIWTARDAPVVVSSSRGGSPHPEQGFSRSRPNTHTGEASHRHQSRSISPFVAPPRTAPGSMPRPHSSTSLPTKTTTTHDPLETHMRAWLTRVEQSQSEVLATVQRLSQAQEILASEQRELAKSCSLLKESHEEAARSATNQLAELHRQYEERTTELLQEALRDHSADYAKRQVKTIHDVSTRIEEDMSRTHAVTQAQLNNIRSSLEGVQSFFSEEMERLRAEQREIARQERRDFYAEFADMRHLLVNLQARESVAVVAAARSTSGVVSPATRSDTPEEFEEFETVRLIANKKNKAKGTESQPIRERIVTRSRSGSTLSLGPCGQVFVPEAQQHRQETPQTVAAIASSPMQEPTDALEDDVTHVDEHRSRRESPRPSRMGDEDPQSKAQKRKKRPGQRYGGASKRQRRSAQVDETEQGGPSSPAASSSHDGLVSADIIQEQEQEQVELPSSSPSQPSTRSRKKRSSKSSSNSKSRSRKEQKQEPRGRARTRSRGSTRRPSVSSHTSHPVAAGENEEMPQEEVVMRPYRYQTRSRSLSCARAGISLLSEALE